jgi:hypothetical protein
MTTSVTRFRNEFTERVLNFVWRQWCQMGVAGSADRRDPWVIDPEPLLAFTTEVARHDARMFDEVLDWLVTNGHWINTQRFSTIVRQDNIGNAAVIGAIAAWMTEQDKSMKWRGLARRMIPVAQKPDVALYHAHPAGALAVFAQPDAHFQRYGLLRGPIRTRGMTRAVNMKEPANLMFKSRAIFGIGIRADVMAYLVASEGSHARRISEILGYNHMRVTEVLAGMAEAGIVAVYSAGRARRYKLDRETWSSVLVPEQSAPRWINWRSLLRGLSTIWREAWALDETRADDYVFSSKMRTAMKEARDDLQGSGIDFTVEDDQGYIAEAYLPVLSRNADAILKALGG